MIRLDGKVVAQSVRGEIKEEASRLLRDYGIRVGLAVIIVGEDPASCVYVRNKQRACEEVGFDSRVYSLSCDTTETELLNLIQSLNEDSAVHGILVQLPLPKHISEEKVTHTIRPDKDVDAFHPYNVGNILLGKPDFLPCTPAGVMEILHHYGISCEGKECVVVGRSNIVGKPQALLLLAENGTVTVCHSRTRNLSEITRRADILVSAVGRPHFITADMVKAGAVVIDVGINRMPDGKLVGDVDYEGISALASAATPVPGGVGPMTITMLLRNALLAAQNSLK